MQNDISALAIWNYSKIAWRKSINMLSPPVRGLLQYVSGYGMLIPKGFALRKFWMSLYYILELQNWEKHLARC